MLTNESLPHFEMEWILPTLASNAVNKLADQLGVSSVVARILATRGITDAKIGLEFLQPCRYALLDTMLLQDLDVAVERIARAITSGERILAYGDYDVDGTCSLAILKRALELLGGTVDFHVPHRLQELYTPDLLDKMHRYWCAANYLSIGQIYLKDNPLLHEPLKPEHIKPRLLGHWGTSPGLSLIYVHLYRLIREHDVDAIYLAGPGHGGPAIVANVYLEGTYSEVYPKITRDEAGMQRLFWQFSTPGGIPSHVSVPTPGSIHEGGELGYVLTHAFGAAFDNPNLLVAAVIGDGEAETGPLAGSWKSTAFLNPSRDGAVLPILHLNGYKIGGP